MGGSAWGMRLEGGAGIPHHIFSRILRGFKPVKTRRVEYVAGWGTWDQESDVHGTMML